MRERWGRVVRFVIRLKSPAAVDIDIGQSSHQKKFKLLASDAPTANKNAGSWPPWTSEGPPLLRSSSVVPLYRSSSHGLLCQYFDNRGHRITLHGEHGCPRSPSSCHFVHPTDPEWEYLVRRDTRRFSDDHSARRSPASPTRGRDRRRSPSFDRVPTSPRRGSGVHIRSPVRRRPSSRSPRRDDPPHDRDVRYGPPRHEPSHERPTLIERLDLDRKPVYPPQPSRPPSQPAMSSHTNFRGPSDHDIKSSSVKGTAAATPSGATTSAPPSEIVTKPSGPVAVPLPRSFSEVLPPPPLQNLSPPGDDTMSPEQQRAVWDKRVA